MKKEDLAQNMLLFPEKPGYPWQVLEADGETWLIVRRKEKVSAHPLSEVSGVSLKKFAWTLVYENAEKCFYRGEIAFQVNYQEMESTPEKTEAQDPWMEEYLFNELLLTEKKEEGFLSLEENPLSLKEENRVVETAFSTLLLDGAELDGGQDSPPLVGNKTWEVVLPWRSWLRGKGTNKPPLLKKVHVAQIGLSTLLLEALIKLERKEEFDFAKEEDPLTVVAEETIFEITQDSVCEIMGLSTERGLGKCSYEARCECLLLQYLKKISLVYVSSYQGGERLSLASSVGEESIRMKNCAESLYPVGVTSGSEQVKWGLIGENKIFSQSKSFCKIQRELEEEKGEVIPESSKPVIKEALPFIKRNKPGEKWLKKRDNLPNCTFKTVMTIKI
ncbi:MAG: hypothetical protein PHS83_05735 [Clostridia bacterium]|nr:hypothetical protein [Clostridia bacterium]MDD4146575.1 hypothetical protein [Clostridia bacterium]